MKYGLCFFMMLASVGCTHSVHLVNFSEFPPNASWQKAKVITSKTEQFVVMGFAFDTEYVNRAYTDLERQCSKGKIAGISSKYYSDHGFFSWTNKIEMQGYCSL